MQDRANPDARECTIVIARQTSLRTSGHAVTDVLDSLGDICPERPRGDYRRREVSTTRHASRYPPSCNTQLLPSGSEKSAKLVVRRIVDVEREAGLIDIEPQRSLDIAHRQRDHLD
jgi:hypothetical protein